jgi:diphthamide biosynthesis protein 4
MAQNSADNMRMSADSNKRGVRILNVE